ncbi:MAG TPA: hypothetical protein VFF69_15015 [Phycisphaerales bacterium]|nr:hypothetical protein [Phycisphaerales bacterium]
MSARFVLAGAAVAAGISVAASGDTVSVVYQGTSGNLGQEITVSLSGGLFFQDGGSNNNVWAGQYSQSIDGAAVKTYCTELTQWAGSGEFDVVSLDQAPNPGPGIGQLKAEAVYQLFNATNRGSDIDTSAEAAAFQATLWEIVYEYEGQASDLALGAGRVRMSGVNSALFDLYKGLAADSDGDKSAVVTALVNQSRQDQMRIVPLPGAAAMAGLALAGLAGARRRG